MEGAVPSAPQPTYAQVNGLCEEDLGYDSGPDTAQGRHADSIEGHADNGLVHEAEGQPAPDSRGRAGATLDRGNSFDSCGDDGPGYGSRIGSDGDGDDSGGGGNGEGALRRFFFGRGARASPAVQRGCAVADRAGAAHFKEAALLGLLDEEAAAAAEMAGGPAGGEELYLNTHEPFCLAAVGVQGGGKSHTMACVLESCLVPFPEQGVVRLRQPMATLVLHYDQNVTSVCEATGLISPLPGLARLLAGAPARCLPREKMVVLVSPSYWRQRKAFYGDYCVVRPLLFRWATLTADHIKKIMRIKDGDGQLYVAAMLDLLRQYQREAVTPAFPVFVQEVRSLCNLKAQEGPLAQRLRLLESVVAEAAGNEALAAESADLYACVRPGVLVVADLTDPLLASDEANGIFQVSLDSGATRGLNFRFEIWNCHMGEGAAEEWGLARSGCGSFGACETHSACNIVYVPAKIEGNIHSGSVARHPMAGPDGAVPRHPVGAGPRGRERQALGAGRGAQVHGRDGGGWAVGGHCQRGAADAARRHAPGCVDAEPRRVGAGAARARHHRRPPPLSLARLVCPRPDARPRTGGG